MSSLRPKVRIALLTIPLMLCIASGLLWQRSYRSADTISWASGQSRKSTGLAASGIYLVSNGATIVLGSESATWPGPQLPYGGHTYAHPRGVCLESQSHRAYSNGSGFWSDDYIDAQSYSQHYVNHERFIRIPWWSVFAVTLLANIPLGIRLMKTRQRRRSRAGLCVCCGYDLRATPERCPECGAPG